MVDQALAQPDYCAQKREVLQQHGLQVFAISGHLVGIGYQGPLSVEWEDSGMDREHGAKESCEFVRKLEFPTAGRAFDASFER